MTTQHEVSGYTTDELVEEMGRFGIHCSLSKMKEFAIALQQRALTQFTSASGLAVENDKENTHESV